VLLSGYEPLPDWKRSVEAEEVCAAQSTEIPDFIVLNIIPGA